MLLITLREGDYFLVNNNVKIKYERSEGKDSIFIAIDAPKEVPIVRGKVYENEIAKLAAAGDPEAQIKSEQLIAEYEIQKRKYNARRNSRAEQERRVAAGKIKPSNPKPVEPVVSVERKAKRLESNRNMLDPTKHKPTDYKDWENEQKNWAKEKVQ